MAQLQDSIEELVRFWNELNKDYTDLATQMPLDIHEQLTQYIDEVESYNEEIDVDTIVGDMEEARYQLDQLNDIISTAMDSLDYALQNAEDLR